MSTLAQEEADRFFNHKPSATSHPEDARHSGSNSEADDDDQPTRRGIKSRSRPDTDDRDPDTIGDDDHDEEETAQRMSSLANTKTLYTVPSTRQYANTGPKGVIADAQNYHRAKLDESRNKSGSNNISHRPVNQSTSSTITSTTTPRHTNGGDDSSDSDAEADLLALENDTSFMSSWREKRLAEMQAQYTSPTSNSNNPPSQRRTYGTLDQVSATTFLSTIETDVPPTTYVVVFLFDPLNPQSLEVEDELKMLAYTWSKTRFVKMHYRIAEMREVEIPALLVYRGGEVEMVLGGCEGGMVEGVLSKRGVLER